MNYSKKLIIKTILKVGIKLLILLLQQNNDTLLNEPNITIILEGVTEIIIESSLLIIPKIFKRFIKKG